MSGALFIICCICGYLVFEGKFDFTTMLVALGAGAAVFLVLAAASSGGGGKPPTDRYREYIESEEWRRKAVQAKERAGWRCQVCNRRGDEVTLDAHHRTYARLGRERPDDITVLCRECHQMYSEARKAI